MKSRSVFCCCLLCCWRRWILLPRSKKTDLADLLSIKTLEQARAVYMEYIWREDSIRKN